MQFFNFFNLILNNNFVFNIFYVILCLLNSKKNHMKTQLKDHRFFLRIKDHRFKH